MNPALLDPACFPRDLNRRSFCTNRQLVLQLIARMGGCQGFMRSCHLSTLGCQGFMSQGFIVIQLHYPNVKNKNVAFC